ncbi:fibronectin type 3 and ankyrin repeat domains 1 protein-like isoform X2 [Gigantopelta aegis]|uniref:fibronectin type 3 and ankyrin repeat domains 1 protein-like isoform X2 n=1 Tax=Gigantopelta aegis TaxID=1735272 RepID=UPI001B8887FF|nr:fibronectin type 3 and ankyrin repeat domains 1 protein-like isoform X2 [Gigantopelta aegis]
MEESDNSDSDMKVLPKPDPPVVGKVTHHTVELYWEETYKEAVSHANGKFSRLRTCVQELDSSNTWGNIYVGYAKRHVVTGLQPTSQYTYRIRFQTKDVSGEWSAHVVVSTTKPPVTAEDLHRAIIRKDTAEIERLLDTGDVSIDVADKYGFSPLMQASQKGAADIVKLLVSYGADVHLKNEAGKTCLMLACFAGQLEVVKLLREAGASYTDCDRGGSSALHWAADGGNVKLIEWMVKDGADVNLKDHHSGWTPLLRCASVGGSRDVALTLLMNGADINAKDNDGKTCLMIAIINGHQALVELLLARRADVYIENQFGKTAIEMAKSTEKRNIIQTLETHLAKIGNLKA